MSLDNQTEYWNKIADSKTFTHPIQMDLLARYVSPNDAIVDFGCGYGRLISELTANGYDNISGYDTSVELIKRGHQNQLDNIFHITSPDSLAIADNSVDAVLLFAVLTCIPSNKGQQELIELLYAGLKPGGILYISDYYLQNNSKEMDRYEYLDNDKDNYGVFSLTERATFRHHSKEWISSLLHIFEIKEEHAIEVKTMNGHVAEAFQIIAQKPKPAL